MLFPTIDFAIFFAVAYTVNWLLNPYARWWKLSMIALSYVFYGWVGWSYCLLLLATTVVSFIGAAWVAATSDERSRRIAMAVSVAALLGILGWFKYYGFVSVNVDNVTHAVGLGRAIPLLQVGLPIAISFFTFMAISYVVDVYRRELEPAKPLDFALYLSFFPHLLSGPIVRGTELLPQIRRRRDPNAVDYSRAFWLILSGLFKKVVISSYVSSAIVTPVFTSPSQHSAPEAIFAAWGYAVQIYCDFSGYTDIAIGLALLLGIRFPQNFDAPVHGAQPAGLLAALAHDALALVAGLPLHPARRECGQPGADHPQHHDHDGPRGAVARRGMDVRGLGRAPGARAELRACAPHQPRAPWAAGGGRRPGAGLGSAVPHLPIRMPGVGVLQCLGHVAGLRRARPGPERVGPAIPARHAAARRYRAGHRSRPSSCPP